MPGMCKGCWALTRSMAAIEIRQVCLSGYWKLQFDDSMWLRVLRMGAEVLSQQM